MLPQAYGGRAQRAGGFGRVAIDGQGLCERGAEQRVADDEPVGFEAVGDVFERVDGETSSGRFSGEWRIGSV